MQCSAVYVSAVQCSVVHCSALQVVPMKALSLQSELPGSVCYPVGLSFPAQPSIHHHSRLRGEKGALWSFYHKASKHDKDVTSAEWLDWFGKEEEQVQKEYDEQGEEGEVEQEVRPSKPLRCRNRRGQNLSSLCTPVIGKQEMQEKREEAKEEGLGKEQNEKEVKFTQPCTTAISSLPNFRISLCPSPRKKGRPRYAQIRAGTRGVVSIKKRRPASHSFCRLNYR